MKAKRFLVGLTVVAVLMSFCAVYGATRATIQQGQATELPQWEYLVLSESPTFYVGARIDTPLHKPVLEEGQTVREAIYLQVHLDNLGKQGWELVAVVGAIGGDQEFVFKRRR